VHAALALESILDGGLTASGAVTAPWTGECRRCLREVQGQLRTEVREVFSQSPLTASGVAAPTWEDSETYPLAGDHVDLEPMVRDAVLLALPLAPLCEDGCLGPDPAGHPVAVEGDEDEGPAGDPRWAALRELKFD
jgi:uncharacterized protein